MRVSYAMYEILFFNFARIHFQITRNVLISSFLYIHKNIKSTIGWADEFQFSWKFACAVELRTYH